MTNSALVQCIALDRQLVWVIVAILVVIVVVVVVVVV